MSISLSNSTLRRQDRPCGEEDECHVEADEEAVFEAVGIGGVVAVHEGTFSRLYRVRADPSFIPS